MIASDIVIYYDITCNHGLHIPYLVFKYTFKYSNECMEYSV